MAIIEEKSRYEPARVVYFDSRRGTGRAITQKGATVRIPLSAIREANLLVLDPGDEIYVALDEHDRARVDKLHLPEPALAKKPAK